MVAEALATAREAGCTGAIVVRGDSKFYTAEVVAAAARSGAFVSLTTGSNADFRTGGWGQGQANW